MYDAIAIAFILVVTAAFYLAVRWAMKGGLMGQAGLYGLIIAIFAIVFVERLVRTVANPSSQNALDWAALIGSLAIVIIYGVRLARAR
jgi:membrane protein implicated in regulation of membrane protease activity